MVAFFGNHFFIAFKIRIGRNISDPMCIILDLINDVIDLKYNTVIEKYNPADPKYEIVDLKDNTVDLKDNVVEGEVRNR